DLVGREIRSNEHAQAGNLQAHVGTSQEPGHVRLPEKMSGRVAIGASAEQHEVFSMRYLRALRADPSRNRVASHDGQRGQSNSRPSHLHPPTIVTALPATPPRRG